MSAPRVTPAGLRSKKNRGQKITMLTAYDFPMASFIDQAGVDIVLVSDAVGTVGNGRGEAVSVSVDEMIYHTRSVRNGAKRCMVVTTMPFASYNTTEDALRTASRLMKEGGADGVHLEGTRREAHLIGEITAAGIPVMGHVGVTKQKIIGTGRIKLPGQDAAGAKEIIGDAVEMARQGAFALVLECLPAALGADHHPQPGHPDDRHRFRRRLRRPGAGDPGHAGAVQGDVAAIPEGVRRPGDRDGERTRAIPQGSRRRDLPGARAHVCDRRRRTAKAAGAVAVLRHSLT